MDITLLRQFLVLARTLNFTQAAGKCYITQPTLSRNIAAMESEFGIQLFKRNKRKVVLTEEGQALLKHVSCIVEEYDRILSIVGPYREGTKGSLTIGYSSYPYILNLCMDAEESLSGRYPDIELNFVYGELHRNLSMLLDDRMDGIFTLDCGLNKYPDLNWEIVTSSDAYVLVSHSHPLFGRESISLKELSGENMIMVQRENNPDLYDFRKKCFLENGILPENISTVANIRELMVMVSRNQGIAVLNEDGHLNTIETIRPIRLEDGVPQLHMSFAWKKNRNCACINRFVEALQTARDEK